MKTIGLVMIVKNEGRSLEKCLSRIRQLVDEIYITDTGSTDETLKIAEKYQAHVSYFKWNNDFSAARNHALAQSKCDWNLVLDADEYLVSGKRKDLQRFVERGGSVGAIQRRDSYREANGELSTGCAYITSLLFLNMTGISRRERASGIWRSFLKSSMKPRRIPMFCIRRPALYG